MNLADNASHKARRNEDRTDWTGVQTQYSEKWSLFWSVAALKTVVYPFHFISFLTHQQRRNGTSRVNSHASSLLFLTIITKDARSLFAQTLSSNMQRRCLQLGLAWLRSPTERMSSKLKFKRPVPERTAKVQKRSPPTHLL